LTLGGEHSVRKGSGRREFWKTGEGKGGRGVGVLVKLVLYLDGGGEKEGEAPGEFEPPGGGKKVQTRERSIV